MNMAVLMNWLFYFMYGGLCTSAKKCTHTDAIQTKKISATVNNQFRLEQSHLVLAMEETGFRTSALNRVEENPCVTMKQIAAELYIAKTIGWRVLHAQLLCLCPLQTVQCAKPSACLARETLHQ
jgi:hypothetical protein